MKATLFITIFVLGFLTGRYTAPNTIPQKLVSISQHASSITTKTEMPVKDIVITSDLSKSKESSSLTRMPDMLPAIIQAAPQQAVKDVVSYFFNEGELAEISDINTFARRYAEEVTLTPAEPDPSSSTTLKISLSANEVEHQALLELNKNQAVYAHVHFGGGIAAGSAKIMSRWVNIDTREVLFFEKSSIIPTSDNNWVSFTPSEGWKDGNYEVSFYQFSDKLKKLATQNFYLTINR